MAMAMAVALALAVAIAMALAMAVVMAMAVALAVVMAMALAMANNNQPTTPLFGGAYRKGEVMSEYNKMSKSKCKHCIEGTVLDDKCEKVIANRFCNIDYWDECVRCREGWCRGYEKRKETTDEK